ncbi:ATP-grasp domain-containing protein [Gordonia sp. LSe1-13]|uniref:ATP-grasp domain-containing protein n=1 Tax=Gordonia sesuvii TaxID=3116777 RepID=A0ABU7MEE0_9ACTN|nr:ATP-grasp domain-containing protein [Gordonia sp. LSe1-13]
MGTSERKHVLITFGRSFLTLELARLMSAAGHRVTIVDSIPIGITRFSHATSAFHRVPAPKFEPRAYCHALAKIVADEKVDMVIPIHEETDILSMMVDIFPPECELFLSDFDTENRLHNKFEFQELLTARRIQTMKYAEVRGPQDVAALDFDAPFALKECYSRGSQTVHKVSPGDSLDWLEFDPLNPWLAQEWVSGKQYCTYSVVHNGRIHAHATYPVDYAIGGSSCLNFRSVQHDGIYAWIEDFVREMNFTGQVGFDFIEHPERGLYCIECNPRATSGIMMFAPEDRVDRAFFGENDEVITPDATVDKMIGLGMLIYGWRKDSRGDRSIRQFLHDFRGARDVVGAPGDNRPALMLPLAYLGIMRSCIKYRVGLAEGFMHDHEWDGLRISE